MLADKLQVSLFNNGFNIGLWYRYNNNIDDALLMNHIWQYYWGNVKRFSTVEIHNKIH